MLVLFVPSLVGINLFIPRVNRTWMGIGRIYLWKDVLVFLFFCVVYYIFRLNDLHCCRIQTFWYVAYAVASYRTFRFIILFSIICFFFFFVFWLVWFSFMIFQYESKYLFFILLFIFIETESYFLGSIYFSVDERCHMFFSMPLATYAKFHNVRFSGLVVNVIN